MKRQTDAYGKENKFAHLLKYIFFVLFFCFLLHRLAVRISLPFHDFLQVIIVLIKAPVVPTLDSAVHRINHHPVGSVIDFCDTFPLDSDLSGG